MHAVSDALGTLPSTSRLRSASCLRWVPPIVRASGFGLRGLPLGDALVGGVHHVHVATCCDGEAVRAAELPQLASFFAELREVAEALGQHLHPMVALVGHVHVAVGADRDTRGDLN